MVNCRMVLCVVLAALAPLAARAQILNDLEGRPYAEVRQVLISRGIRPVRIERDEPPYTRTSQMGKTYPEVLSCAGTGVAPCSFAFRDARSGELIVVLTYGGTRLTVKGFRSPPSADDRAKILGVKAPAPAHVGPFESLEGRPYDEVRAVLASRGISPVRVSHDDAPWACAEGRCETYPEVLDCAGAGTGGCTFAFWNGRADEPLVVITRGEVDPVVAAVEPPSPAFRAKILGGE